MEDKIEYEEVPQFTTNSITHLVPLLLAIHAESQDFNSQPISEFIPRVHQHLTRYDSLNLEARVGSELVGVCSVLVEDDVHVGECLSVQWQYILPQYRGVVGIHMMRWVFSVANRLRVQFVAYTQRKSDFEHVVKYKRMRYEQS